MKSANEKKMEAYNQMCVRLGLQPSSEYEAFCGVVSGYDVVVSVPDKRYPCNFTVVTSAEGTMLLDKAMSKEIVKMHKAVKTAKQTGRQIRITMQCRGYKDVADAVYEAVNGLVSYLSSHGLAPCCSNCGQHNQTADYLVGAGSVVQLCPECANNYGSRMALDNQQNAMKKDNVVAGVVGAFLGSIIGVICIIIIGELGYVAAISGVVMAICVLKGYEVLGGKASKKGIVISVIIMLVMTWVGDRLDWAIIIYKELSQYADVNITIFDCYRMIPDMLSEGYMDMSNYITNLVMIYAFLLLGMIPTVKGFINDKKNENRMIRIGGANSTVTTETNSENIE